VIGGKVLDASALTVAWADIPSSGREVLEVLLNLRALDSSVEVEELP
jgi:hypothetical protein